MRDASSEQYSRCGAVYVVREGGARVAHLHHRHSSSSSSSCINMCREVRIQGGTLFNRATASLYKSASLAVTMRRLLPCLALPCLMYTLGFLVAALTCSRRAAHVRNPWLTNHGHGSTSHRTSPHLTSSVSVAPVHPEIQRYIRPTRARDSSPPPPHYPRRPALHPP